MNGAKLTPAEAGKFERFSIVNATVLCEAAVARGCECKPYADWFTCNRWVALGFQVQRGQKGTAISTVVKRVTGEGADQKETSFPKTAHVFCRCQVQPAGDALAIPPVLTLAPGVLAQEVQL